MIQQGRIYKVLPMQKGQRADGSEWRAQDYLFEYFETPEQRYSDKLVFTLLNDEIEKHALKEFEEIRLGFGLSLRENGGRYYQKISIYKIEKLTVDNGVFAPQEETPSQPAQPQTEIPAEPQENDLPF